MKWSTLILAGCCLVLSGCNNVPRANAPLDCQVFDRFEATQLNVSTSNDVLKQLCYKDLAEEELLSQSESVIAYWGQRGDYAATWFNIVSFDEDSLAAKRKYSFLVDEDSPGWWTLALRPSKKLRLDMMLIVDDGTLDEPYASESAMTRAVIARAQKLFLADMVDVREDSHALDSVSMLINTTFNQLLEQVDRTPATTVRICERRGLDFDHATLGKAKIRMCIKDNIVRLKIKVGDITENFEEHEDVICM